jgi:hypothetical protein
LKTARSDEVRLLLQLKELNMKALLKMQEIVKTNLILDDNVIQTIADSLNNNKTEAEILRGHILVNFKGSPSWETVNEIYRTVIDICPQADKEVRLRPEFGFSADSGKSNTVIKNLEDEFTVHAFAGDNPADKIRDGYAHVISIDRLLEKQHREDVTSDIWDNKEYFNLTYPRRIGMLASARMLKMKDGLSAAFEVEFIMLNIGRIDQPYATISRVHYLRDFTIPEKRNEAIGILDFVGKKVQGVHTQFAKDIFSSLYSTLEGNIRDMIANTRQNGLKPEDCQVEQNVSNHNLIDVNLTFPDMITSFYPFGYNQGEITSMRKQFKNLQDTHKNEGPEYRHDGNRRNYAQSQTPKEYDVAPEGLTSKLFPNTLRIVVPTDFRNLLVKHIALTYAVNQSTSPAETEDQARLIELEIRRHPELLKPVEQPEADSAGATGQAAQGKEGKKKNNKPPKPPKPPVDPEDPLAKMQSMLAPAAPAVPPTPPPAAPTHVEETAETEYEPATDKPKEYEGPGSPEPFEQGFDADESSVPEDDFESDYDKPADGVSGSQEEPDETYPTDDSGGMGEERQESDAESQPLDGQAPAPDEEVDLAEV